MRTKLPTGAETGDSPDAFGTTTVNSPNARSLSFSLRTNGPLVASNGTCVTIIPSVHCAIVPACPLNSTACSGVCAAPNPFPNKTTFVPMGPVGGSTRIEGMTFKATVLLVLYSTGAQHDPSGNGSDDASRTTTSPDAAFPGTSTSIVSLRHLRTLEGTPLISTSLTPNIVLGSFEPDVFVKFVPAI